MDSDVSSNFAAKSLIRSPKRSGRPISECIASAQASGSKVTLGKRTMANGTGSLQ